MAVSLDYRCCFEGRNFIVRSRSKCLCVRNFAALCRPRFESITCAAEFRDVRIRLE